MDGITIYNVVGEVSNVIAAGCALTAIIITVRENKRIGDQSYKVEKKHFLSARFEALCIDRIVGHWDELYKQLVGEFDKLRTAQDEYERREIGDNMEEECNRFEVNIRFLKLFDHNLYRSAADCIDYIHDIIAESVDNKEKKYQLSKSKVHSQLTKIGEYGYKIVDMLHKFECGEIWEEK